MVLSDFFHHCQIQILEALGLFCAIFCFIMCQMFGWTQDSLVLQLLLQSHTVIHEENVVFPNL